MHAEEDLFTEVVKLVAGGMAIVNQDEGLAGVDAGVAVAVAFPAALLDQPAGSQFGGVAR